MQDLGAQIRSGTFWLFADKAGMDVVQFLFGIALARILVPEDFGVVATVGIFTGLAGFFSGAGMGQALVRAKEAEARHFQVVLTLQIAIGCLIYSVFFMIAPWFSRFFENDLYQTLLRVSALTFFIRPFSSIPVAKLTREMRFRPLMLVNSSLLVLTGAMSITMAVRGFGPWSLVLPGVASGMLRGVCLSFTAKYRPRFAFDREIARDLGSYGFKVATNGLLEYFRGRTAILLLSKLRGPGDVGIFNKAWGLAEAPMRVVGSAPYQAVFRALATLSGNRDQSKYVYYRTITLVAVYTFPIYVGLWWLAKPTILVLYGAKWGEAGELLRILACTGFLNCIANPSGAVVEARNRLNAEILLNIVSWLLFIGGFFWAMRWGLTGVAWAAVTMVGFFACCLAAVAAKELGGRLRDLIGALKPALLLNSILFVSLAFVDSLLSGIYRGGPPSLYVILMAAFGAVTYACLFLFLPIPSISSEVVRWKQRFRFSKERDVHP